MRSELLKGITNAVERGDTDSAAVGKKLFSHLLSWGVLDLCFKIIKMRWLCVGILGCLTYL